MPTRELFRAIPSHLDRTSLYLSSLYLSRQDLGLAKKTIEEIMTQ